MIFHGESYSDLVARARRRALSRAYAARRWSARAIFYLSAGVDRARRTQ
jgi:hypothetical protein